MRDAVEHSEHMMKVLTSSSVGPNYWERDECKQIRESILFIKANPDIYPAILGDELPDGSTFSVGYDSVANEDTA